VCRTGRYVKMAANAGQGDAALEQARDRIAAVRELVREGGFERIDVEPIGGVGHPATAKGFTTVNLEQVEDQAPKFGFGELGEARFARGDDGLEILATGAHTAGDAEMAPGYWPE
jgi:hypothetical protein